MKLLEFANEYQTIAATMYQWMLRNPLQVILWAVVALALWHPEWGHSGASWHPELIASTSVSMMFFMHGLTLRAKDLWSGIKDWRLHIIIQLATFALFPVIGFGILLWTHAFLTTAVQFGFFILCATSSTIASSVAFTAQSGGRVSLAVFNASLSTLLGVFLTPLLAGLVADHAGLAIDFTQAFHQIFFKVLLPLGLGQLIRVLMAAWLSKLGRYSALVDYTSIALTVFNAISDSVSQGAFANSGIFDLLAITLVASCLFWLVIAILTGVCRLFKVGPADQMAVFYCGSQKSIANGVPIAKVMFAGSSGLGLMLLPLVVYHQCQLLYSSVLAALLERQLRDTSSPPHP